MQQKIEVEKVIVDQLFSGKTDEQLKKNEVKVGLHTGIGYVDTDFGFPTGNYVIIGNPGTGKSWFALWLTRMFYRNDGMKSVYFSLEMTEQVIRTRILQQWSDITKQQLETGANVQDAINLMKEDVLVVDTTFQDTNQDPALFEEFVDKFYELGYRIFHFDHLHELMGANDNKSNQTITEKWAKVFQQICKKYSDIWLFIYAQPNGASANKKILRRTDIAGSKAITQKCDYCLSLNRNLELDDNGVPIIDKTNREIIVFVDKSRFTIEQYFGFKLYFHLTGNFHAIYNN